MEKIRVGKMSIYWAVSLVSMLLTACSSDKEQQFAQLETCINHYKAESYQVAENECRLSAEQGSSQAQWLMAHIYRYNLTGNGENIENAFHWYLQAAESGHVSAMREVGRSYMYQEGVETDFTKAHEWLTKAAAENDSEAQFSVGVLFFEGWGRERDMGSAVSWFKRAAARNHNMSINNLAWVFATSENNAFNSPKKAKFWIEKLDESLLEVPMFLDTKAAVMAASDDFEEAIKLQNKAIAKLPTDTTEEQLVEFQKHLDNYLQGKAWYE